jgi:hypothetical protein
MLGWTCILNYISLLSYPTSTCFGDINSPSSGGWMYAYVKWYLLYSYEGLSKIFWTDALKIIKLTTRPIGRHRPRISSLSHVDTDTTVFSIFGTLPGSSFLSECQELYAIRPGSPHWYQTGVLSASVSCLQIGRSHRVSNQESTVGVGW